MRPPRRMAKDNSSATESSNLFVTPSFEVRSSPPNWQLSQGSAGLRRSCLSTSNNDQTVSPYPDCRAMIKTAVLEAKCGIRSLGARC